MLKNIICDSYRNPILSSSVPLDYYLFYIFNKDKIDNLKIKEFIYIKINVPYINYIPNIIPFNLFNL